MKTLASQHVYVFVFILCIGDVLDNAISDVYLGTACPCTPRECAANDAGYKIGIALVQKMLVDREVHSLDELSGLVIII